MVPFDTEVMNVSEGRLKISVYITSYNQKDFLVRAIDSVLHQTLRPSEIIIVDGSSTDGSQEVIAEFSSRYPDLITPIYHSQNIGVAQARIDALRAVTGDYVTHLDGDDRFLPTKLESEARLLLDNPSAQIAYSNHYYVNLDGAKIGVWADGVTPPQGDVFRQTFTRDFPRGSLFRNELVDYGSWKRVGFHDPKQGLYEDYEMLIRLTKHLQVAYVDEPLAEYRIHEEGLSRAPAADHLGALERIYRKNEPLLRDLNIADRKEIQRKLDRRMARIARQAAREAVEHCQQGRMDALDCYLRCLKYQLRYSLDYKLILGILLPQVWNKNRVWQAAKG